VKSFKILDLICQTPSRHIAVIWETSRFGQRFTAGVVSNSGKEAEEAVVPPSEGRRHEISVVLFSFETVSRKCPGYCLPFMRSGHVNLDPTDDIAAHASFSIAWRSVN